MRPQPPFSAFLLFLLLVALAACDSPASPPLLPQTPAPAATPTLASPGAVAAVTLPPPPAVTLTAPAVAPAATPLTTVTTVATVTPVPTATSVPTVTPLPAARLAAGLAALANQDYATAIEQLEQAAPALEKLPLARQQALRVELARAYLYEDRLDEGRELLSQVLAAAAVRGPEASSDSAASEAAYFLAGAYELEPNCAAAVASYQQYLEANPDMAPYVEPLIAACLLALDDRAGAVAAYERAVAVPAARLAEVPLRQKLAELYLEDGRFDEAIAQYDAILAVAVTPFTRSQTLRQAGQAALLAGDREAGYARFLEAVTQYPGSYDSYQALIALVDAGIPVDAFQRGLVDFQAGAYQPAVDALQRYLANAGDDFRVDTYLYLAWSFEGLGDLPAALAQLDAYAQAQPAAAQLERARLLARAGQSEAAIGAYLAYVETYADEAEAAGALWDAANLWERLDDPGQAVALYLRLANGYQADQRAPEALFRAGLLSWRMGQEESALAEWRGLVQRYPDDAFGAAALVWLLRRLPPQAPERESLVLLAQAERGEGYYALRAREAAAGLEPFQAEGRLVVPAADDGLEEATTWLATRFGLDAAADLAQLPPELAADPRLRRGEKLWRLGRYREAGQEWDELRQAFAADAAASFALAIRFRDVGFYRGSILAAGNVWRLAGGSLFDLPPFLARLHYPVYYADLILPLAGQYGYDPLLQFALVRQESLFDSFITSPAAAQGLSQVIPDTGQYIARRLGWANYSNEMLYRPYVGLAFGAYYLSEQLRAFHGSVYAALAAYNAGPGNAAFWYDAAPDDPDDYLEWVNIAETRAYITRIFVGYEIYQHLYRSR